MIDLEVTAAAGGSVDAGAVFVPALDRFIPRDAVGALRGVARATAHGPRAVVAAVALAWACAEALPADAEDTLIESVRRNDLLADVAAEALARIGVARGAAALRRCLLLATTPAQARRAAEALLGLLFADGVVAWDDDVVIARDLALRALVRSDALWQQDTGFLARHDLPTAREDLAAMAA